MNKDRRGLEPADIAATPVSGLPTLFLSASKSRSKAAELLYGSKKSVISKISPQLFLRFFGRCAATRVVAEKLPSC